MGNLSRLAWSHLIDHQGHDRHGFSIERGKFDLIPFARRTHENDRADIASSKAVLRQTAVQDHVFQFLNHLLLRKRGSCNESRCVTLVVNKPSRANVQHASVRHLQRSVNNVSCSEPCLFFACNLVVRRLLPQSSLQLFPSLGIKTPPLSFLSELPRFENSRIVETISDYFFSPSRHRSSLEEIAPSSFARDRERSMIARNLRFVLRDTVSWSASRIGITAANPRFTTIIGSFLAF